MFCNQYIIAWFLANPLSSISAQIESITVAQIAEIRSGLIVKTPLYAVCSCCSMPGPGDLAHQQAGEDVMDNIS